MTDGAVNSIVKQFSGQPLVFALVLMNFCLLGYLYYAGAQAANERDTRTKLLYENRKYVTDVLASCLHVDDIEKLLKRQ